YLDSWETYAFEVEDIAEVGPGKVVAICREHGKPKEGGDVDRRFGGLWGGDNGKIVSWGTYLTPREAVRAAKELLGGKIEQDQIKRRTGPTAPPENAAPARARTAEPAPAQSSATERPRDRPLTKSEEQERPGTRPRTRSEKKSAAPRARAKPPRRSSQQTA